MRNCFVLFQIGHALFQLEKKQYESFATIRAGCPQNIAANSANCHKDAPKCQLQLKTWIISLKKFCYLTQVMFELV